jgi:hypothetical protein
MGKHDPSWVVTVVATACFGHHPAEDGRNRIDHGDGVATEQEMIDRPDIALGCSLQPLRIARPQVNGRPTR